MNVTPPPSDQASAEPLPRHIKWLIGVVVGLAVVLFICAIVFVVLWFQMK